MDKAERLALAVRAEVAGIRAEQARERHFELEQRAAPLHRALEDLEERYGEEVDPGEHIEEFKMLVVQHGGTGISLPDVMDLLVGMHQADEYHAAVEAALNA